ncbi:MAG TPA: DEAD/DEAH box helicase family protein [Bryobacteraceae bacterium]|nr:DEAD/DEAH box helicase family protein [Bryobacteraceae bacterium]
MALNLYRRHGSNCAGGRALLLRFPSRPYIEPVGEGRLRRQLLDQWHERLAMFLAMSANTIGRIGGGRSDRTGLVDVAVIQSLHRKDEVKDFVAEYGHVIVDECHHISAFTFEQVMKQVKARYIVGLTATPTRDDPNDAFRT